MFDLTPASIISRFVVFLIAMAVHEYAHAYAAYTQGDTTARDAGRIMLLLGVGVALLLLTPIPAWSAWIAPSAQRLTAALLGW